MNWKVLLSLFIIVAITGLLMFSDKGKDIRDLLAVKVGDFIETISGKFEGVTLTGKTLDIVLNVERVSLRSQEFKVSESDFNGVLIYEKITISDQNIRMAEDSQRVEFAAEDMTAAVKVNEGLGMEITGFSGYIELNDMIFTPQAGKNTFDFYVSGIPVSFSLSNVQRNEMRFSDVSGELSISGIESPLMLANDEVTISGFVGEVSMGEDSAIFYGKVNRIILNGIDLSLT